MRPALNLLSAWLDKVSAYAFQYTIRPGGEVVLTRAPDGDSDHPALAPFLGFLAGDLAEHPERPRAMNADFMLRIHALVGDVEVDVDVPLSADHLSADHLSADHE